MFIHNKNFIRSDFKQVTYQRKSVFLNVKTTLCALQ